MKSKLFFLVIFFILFVSCEEKSDIPHTTVDILIEYPSDLEELSVQYETVKFKNISSGMETEYSNSKQFSLPEGLYDCSYEASVAYLPICFVALKLTYIAIGTVCFLNESALYVFTKNCNFISSADSCV